MQRLAEIWLDSTGRWKLEALELPGGPVGLLLRGPRGRAIYLPPVITPEERYALRELPKYIRGRLAKLIGASSPPEQPR